MMTNAKAKKTTIHITFNDWLAQVERIVKKSPVWVEVLKEKGVMATVEHPGWILVEHPQDCSYSFGTANEVWDYDYTTERIMFSDETTVPSTCQDASTIADAVLAVINEKEAA